MLRCTPLVVCLVSSLALTPLLVRAQSCAGFGTILSFKSPDDPYGLPSYISSTTSLTVNYSIGIALPLIIVNALTLSADAAVGYDFSLDGSSVICTTTPPVALEGNSAPLSRGQAAFTALTFREMAPSGSNLTCSVTTPLGATISVSSGELSFVSNASSTLPATLQFANAGFFVRPGQSRVVPIGAPLPAFSLEILSSTGYVLSNIYDVVVYVNATGASVTPTTLESLTNLAIEVNASGSFTLSFTVNALAPLEWMSPQVLSTGELQPAIPLERNRFMLFDSSTSYITMENAGGSAVLNIPLPPIIIHLYTSSMDFDPTNTGCIITASSAQGYLIGAEAIVKQGTAIFSALTFVGVAPAMADVIFTAGYQGNLAVGGSILSGGTISVAESVTEAAAMSFAPSSTISTPQQQPYGFNISLSGQSFALPNIVVQMQNSAGQLDLNANGIVLTVSLIPSDVATAQNTAALTATVTNGLAVFNNINFNLQVAPLLYPLQLQISDQSGLRAPLLSTEIYVAQNPIVTASASEKLATAQQLLGECYVSSTRCVFALTFDNTYGSFSSSIYSANQQTIATVGVNLPVVVVQLRDQFGVSSAIPSAVAPALVAFTGVAPDAEVLLVTKNGANYGVWQNGRYLFACLQFAQLPQAPVRIQFMPIDTSVTPAAWYIGIANAPLQTGFFSVAATTTPNFAIRFSSSQNSFFIYEGQSRSAVLNVALPTVVVELVDSEWAFDDSDSTTFVVASVSSGALTGSVAPVVSGRAFFPELTFSSVSDAPVLTFTLFGQAASTVPAIGSSISTGFIQLTSLPIPEFSLDLSSTLDNNNMITHQLTPLVFPTLSSSTVSVSLVIRNSGNTVASTVSDLIEITPSSEQAILSNTAATQSIDSTTSCACANFSITITGYQAGFAAGMPIYITYTVTTGPAYLLGQSVAVGPIAINELDQTSTACPANVVSPGVVIELRVSLSSFSSENFASALGTLLDIDPTRVVIPSGNIVSISRVDLETLLTWTGTQITVFFLDEPPSTTPNNALTSAQLAQMVVALIPGCDLTGLGLAAVYYQSDATLCDLAALQQSVDDAVACTAAGILPQCQCYSQGVVAQWGQPCLSDPSASATLSNLCSPLSTCAAANIVSLCGLVGSSSGTSLTWLWATIGSIAGIIFVVALLRRWGYLRFRRRVNLGDATAIIQQDGFRDG